MPTDHNTPRYVALVRAADGEPFKLYNDGAKISPLDAAVLMRQQDQVALLLPVEVTLEVSYKETFLSGNGVPGDAPAPVKTDAPPPK